MAGGGAPEVGRESPDELRDHLPEQRLIHQPHLLHHQLAYDVVPPPPDLPTSSSTTTMELAKTRT